MRIGIDALSIGNQGGTGMYAQKLIDSLASVDPCNHYVIFLNSGASIDLMGNGNFHPVHVQGTQSSLRRILFEQTLLSRQAKRHRLDVLHFPATISSFFHNRMKTVTTVHDLAYLHLPGSISWHKKPYYSLMVPRSIKKSSLLMTDAAGVKEEIHRLFKRPLEQIEVVYPGVDEAFCPRSDEGLLEPIRAKYRLPEHFLLFVGTMEPRKNLPRLFLAFQRIQKKLPHTLVMVGRKGWQCEDLFPLLKHLHLEERVLFLGFVPEEDLPFIYNLAEVFIYPSLYEGFGLPLLEAMASGVPIITSNTPCMPEVVGDAALKVDPYHYEELTRAMETLLSSDSLREELRRKGLEKARNFSWGKTARATLALYSRLA